MSDTRTFVKDPVPHVPKWQTNSHRRTKAYIRYLTKQDYSPCEYSPSLAALLPDVSRTYTRY